MISSDLSPNLILLSYFYLIVYNFSLFLFFSIFFHFNFKSHSTLNVLEKINSKSFPLFLFSTILISLAGVPPSIGFVSKLMIFVALLESPLAILIFLFFPILMVSLYFYMQNIRFLFSQTPSNFVIESPSMLSQPILISYSILGLILILSGFFIFEDLWLVISWLFS